jgi:hypothetical protein
MLINLKKLFLKLIEAIFKSANSAKAPKDIKLEARDNKAKLT